MDSDDDFGDDDFGYNSILETELQAIESNAYARAQNILLSVTQAQGTAQQANREERQRTPAVSRTAFIPDEAVRRAREGLEHVVIALEGGNGEDGEDGEDGDRNLESRELDNGVEDVLNLSGSQQSVYEDALVEQVMLSVPQGGSSFRSTNNPLQGESSFASFVSGTTTLFDAPEVTPDHANDGDDPMANGEPDTSGEGETKSKRRKNISLFKRFRKRGFFSVTDLVSPGWCEVQYDYRLRSMPYLPVADRPSSIITSSGTTIPLNKTLATSHETIMKKGEIVHKALEMEIHPVEVKVTTTTREDVWGLRFLNMLGSLEALMGVGKCREMPVVGFIRGYMVVGVIDEIVRKPVISLKDKAGNSRIPLGDATNLPDTPANPELTTSPAPRKRSPSANKVSKGRPASPALQQSLKTFFTFTPIMTPSRIAKEAAAVRKRSHSIYVSDSKTRAGGTMPREENAKGGKMQLMLYKELLDGMILEGLRGVHQSGEAEGYSAREKGKGKAETTEGGAAGPSTTPLEQVGPSSSPVDKFTWSLLWSHLDLSPEQPFSETFLSESRNIISGNGLSESTSSATCLADMVACWSEYVARLGLGRLDPELAEAEGDNKRVGRTEMLLELVYRRVEQSKRRKKKRSRKEGDVATSESSIEEKERLVEEAHGPAMDVLTNEQEEERLMQSAISESLKDLDASSISPESDPIMVPSSNMELDLGQTVTEEVAPGVRSGSFLGEEAEMEPMPSSLFPPSQAAIASELEIHTETPPETSGTEVDIGIENSAATPHPPSSNSPPSLSSTSEEPSPSAPRDVTAGHTSPTSKRDLPKGSDIIGYIRFTHSTQVLSAHLTTALDFWMGRREPVGVQVEDVARCGWCEFEEGCEWRSRKAEEAAEKGRRAREERERSMVTI